MKKKLTWYLAGVLILGLALLAVSCGAPAAEEPAPTPTAPAVEEPAATGGPSAISHTLEGREDCQPCHGESGSKPFPANHAGYPNDTCTACHQPAG